MINNQKDIDNMNIRKWLFIGFVICGCIACPPAGIVLVISLILYNKFYK